MGGGGEGVEMEAEQREVVAWAGVAVEVAGGGDAGGGGRGGGGVGGDDWWRRQWQQLGQDRWGSRDHITPPSPLIFFFYCTFKK